MRSPGIKWILNQAQQNMDNINIGGWVDKSQGINYECQYGTRRNGSEEACSKMEVQNWYWTSNTNWRKGEKREDIIDINAKEVKTQSR